jgi:hypothetical protein
LVAGFFEAAAFFAAGFFAADRFGAATAFLIAADPTGFPADGRFVLPVVFFAAVRLSLPDDAMSRSR